MGLQIRLTHSLGQRMVELQPRGADQPVIIGRAPQADIQVPSANVGRQHCILFVHEGRWCIQDAGTQQGTFLNAEPVGEPVFLNSGDVISLGGGVNPPTLTVDPFGLGSLSVGDPESTGLAQPGGPGGPSADAPSYSAYGAAGGLPQPGGAGAPDGDNIFSAAPAGPAYAGAAAPPSAEDAAWANIKPEKRYYIPKKKTASPGLIIGIVATAGLAMIILMVVVYQTQRKNAEEQAKPKKIIIQKEAPRTGGGTSIFDFGPGSGSQPRRANPDAGKEHRTTSQAMAPKVRPRPDQPDQTAPTTNVEPAPDNPPKPEFNAEKQDARWQAIEEGKFERAPLRIYRCQDYLQQVPQTTLKKELEVMIEDALDEIWWKRIDELMDDRGRMQEDIKRLKEEISTSQSPELKKDNQAKIDRLQEQTSDVDRLLKEMDYAGEARPMDLTDAQRAALRKKRDSEYYESKWKPVVLDKIHKSLGRELPWKFGR